MNRMEQDLKRALTMLSASWNMQTDRDDKATNFIYQMNSLDACLQEIKRRGVDQAYALHRWYNYMTSVRCEYIFCEYGAVHDQDIYNHDVDIYINRVPFDVKLTVYPSKLSGRPYDLSTRAGKNDMIQWYYANQSQQGRKQLLNRLYVVCDAGTTEKNLAMKSDFDKMRERIAAYMQDVKTQGLNEVKIENKLLKSDIILLN